MNTTPRVGQNVRITAGINGDVVGGGVVLAVDMIHVTVAQPFVWRSNGVIVERGTTPTRFSLSTHTFTTLVTYACNDCGWSVTADEGDAGQDAYNHSREYGHCVSEGDTAQCNAYCGRWDH